MKLEPANIICPKCGSPNYMRHLIGKNVGHLDLKCINCNSYFNFDELYDQRIAEVLRPNTTNSGVVLIERLRRNLRYYVAVQNWTQAKLAEKVGVCVQAVGDWLNGRRNPSLKHIEQMAKVFGVDPQILFAEKDPVQGRLISADRLIWVLEKNYGHAPGVQAVKELIDIQPTVWPAE